MMAYDNATRKLDRREADLLLNVVFAHMSLSRAKDCESHRVAHDRFKEAVRVLHQFVTSIPKEDAAREAHLS
jgi:hypothetical protein